MACRAGKQGPKPDGKRHTHDATAGRAGEDYDRRHSLPPDKSSPAETRYLLDVSGKPASALTSVFGQRSHVNEALTGKRPISADQARRLDALFSVKPGLFV